MSIEAKLKFERTDIMEKITTIEIDADKVSLFNARLNKFGDLLTEKSDCLIEYCETANLITKRLYLETESLRAVKDSLKSEIASSLKEEFNTASTSFGNRLFATFSGKATTFLDGRFASVIRANDDLKKTINTWSNLSFKSISLLALSSILIGLSTFFASHYLMPSQKLTEADIKCMYYGKAYILNSEKFPKEILRIVAEEADKLMKR